MTNIPLPELVEIDELSVDGENPNRMTKAQLKRLQSSMEKYGFIVPIITNKNLLIADGEQRWTVAKELGLKKVSVVRLNVKDVDRRLIRQVMNKLCGEHDLIADALEFERIIELGSEDKLKELLDLSDSQLERYFAEIREPRPEVYDIPEIEKVETSIVRGDILKLGSHRLMCGDATCKEDVSALMDGKKADMVFTDPPYNVDYGESKNPKHKYRTIKGDKQSPKEWNAFCEALGSNLAEYCEGGVYVCHASGPEGMRLSWILAQNHHWSATIIWYKNRIVLTPAHYQRQYEPIFYGWKKGLKVFFTPRRDLSEVWQVDKPVNSPHHPTMKPLGLCRRAIIHSSKPNDIVADWFGGSGQTLIACEQMGRRCYMMEIDPRYCQVIVDRWQTYTGQKAELVKTGENHVRKNSD